MLLMPEKMTKIRVIISKDYYKKVLSYLYDLGIMEIDEMPQDLSKYVGMNEGNYYEDVLNKYSSKFKSLKSMLYESETTEKFDFKNIDELISKAESIDIYDDVLKTSKSIDNYKAEKSNNEHILELLNNIKDFNSDLSLLNSTKLISYVIYKDTSLKSQKEIILNTIDSIRKSIKDSMVIDLENAYIVTINRIYEGDLGKIFSTHKVKVEAVPELSGTVKDVEDKIVNENKDYSSKIDDLKNHIKELSDKYYNIVSAINEQLDVESQEFGIMSKLGATKHIMTIDGWIASKDLKRLDSILKKVTEGKYILQKIKTKEVSPTKLSNNKHYKLFEAFIKFYSLPQSNEFDPTLLFAIIFPIFFGLMVGDAGYGIIMLILSLALVHFLGKNNSKKNLEKKPNKIMNFVHTIVSDNGLLILAKSIIPGSIIAIIFGVIFNEYLGFHLPFYAGFSLTAKLSTMLLISGWIGVGMITFGMILGFINSWRVNNKKHAIGRIGWILLEFGIVFLGLMILHTATADLGTTTAIIYYIMMVLGIGIIFYADGTESLIEIPSLVSNILSYTRLIGILLASVILAGVVDTIFLGSLNHSIPMIILGIIILVFGQIFTLVIAMFEPGIQGARLIYVELFSNFFKGNGVPFKPYTGKRIYTVSKVEKEQ